YYATNKSITKTKTTFTLKFKMLKASDSNCRFSFGLGMFKGKLYIDNVSIQKVAATSTTAFQETDGIEIFPNPTSHELNIMNKSLTMGDELFIYDNVGRLVHAQRLEIDLTTVEISSFLKGIYFLKVSGDNKVYPFVKQ
ncbi:MAG: hypothetical protein RLZZ479_860, partial [Bacteroidota bacterium]